MGLLKRRLSPEYPVRLFDLIILVSILLVLPTAPLLDAAVVTVFVGLCIMGVRMRVGLFSQITRYSCFTYLTHCRCTGSILPGLGWLRGEAFSLYLSSFTCPRATAKPPLPKCGSTDMAHLQAIDTAPSIYCRIKFNET